MAEHIINGEGKVGTMPEQEALVVGSSTVDSLERLADEADDRVTHILKIKAALLRLTNENDWVLFDMKPYPTAAGAEKLAMAGVSITDTRNEKVWDDDGDGRYYIWSYYGTFSLEGMSRKLEAVGTCTSRDQFFAKVRGELKPLKDVDQSNIMKAAYSNMMVNGVMRLLGMRNLTLDDLKQAGLDIEGLAKVEYQKGSQGATTEEGKGMQNDLWRICLEMGSGDPKEAAAILEDLSSYSFVPRSGDKEGQTVVVAGKKNVKDLTEARVKKTLEGAERAVAKYRAATEGGADHSEAKDRADLFNTEEK